MVYEERIRNERNVIALVYDVNNPVILKFDSPEMSDINYGLRNLSKMIINKAEHLLDKLEIIKAG